MGKKAAIGLASLGLALFSCTSTAVVVSDEPTQPTGRPPGLIVASDKNLENGKKQLRKGHCKQAIHEFEKSLRKNPENFEALYWLGVAQGMCGYYSDANDRFFAAVRYSPNRTWTSRVYATIGLTLILSGRYAEGRYYVEKAKAIDPNNPLVVYIEENRYRVRGGYEITLRWLD